MKASQQIIKDLGQKASDDALEAIHRTTALLPEQKDRAQVAVMAMAGPVSLAAAYVAASIEQAKGKTVTPEQVVTHLWSLVEPMVIAGVRIAQVAGE